MPGRRCLHLDGRVRLVLGNHSQQDVASLPWRVTVAPRVHWACVGKLVRPSGGTRMATSVPVEIQVSHVVPTCRSQPPRSRGSRTKACSLQFGRRHGPLLLYASTE